MLAISIKTFGGIMPRVNNRLLPDQAAQTATSARLDQGTLTAWLNTSTIQAKARAGTVQTMYRFGTSTASDTNHWFEFTSDVDIVRGPVNADTLERTYYTGDGAPKYTVNTVATTAPPYPSTSYTLGIPVPAAAPNITITGDASSNAAEAEDRVYVYTYVTSFGEEGPPSDPSEMETYYPSTQAISVGNMSVAPGGAYVITAKRIYRVNVNSSGGEYQFVAEIPVATTTYSDTVANRDLGEVLPSEGWLPPPTTMQGLKLMANGIGVGFTENTVCLSEPYMLHAWPIDAQRTVDAKIVGVGVFGQSVAVLTTSHPWIMTGVDPFGMTLDKIPYPQACVSKRSIAGLGDGVVYAAPDGLVLLTMSGPSLVTEQLMTTEQWRAYKPDSMHGYFHDGRYFCFYDTGVTQGLLLFSFGGSGDPVLTVLPLYATAGYQDPITDMLYLMVGGNVVKWNAGSALTYTWKSKKFTTPQPMCMAAGMVLAKNYPVSFSMWADGVLKHTLSVPSREPFRLPSGYMAQDWEVQLQGTVEVEQVIIADGMQALKTV